MKVEAEKPIMEGRRSLTPSIEQLKANLKKQIKKLKISEEEAEVEEAEYSDWLDRQILEAKLEGIELVESALSSFEQKIKELEQRLKDAIEERKKWDNLRGNILKRKACEITGLKVAVSGLKEQLAEKDKEIDRIMCKMQSEHQDKMEEKDKELMEAKKQLEKRINVIKDLQLKIQELENRIANVKCSICKTGNCQRIYEREFVKIGLI